MDYRGFGGGLGFGTPVVSYAPRPMLTATISLVIMEAVGMLGGKSQRCSGGERKPGTLADSTILYRPGRKNGKVKSFDSPRGEGRCCLLHLGGPEAEIHRDSGFFWGGGGAA
jgi:hypothetical protein